MAKRCPRCDQDYGSEIGQLMHRCPDEDKPTVTHDVLLPTPTPSICQQTLQTALALTGGDRAKQHGDKRANHQNIADLWNAYFSRNSAAPDGATEWRSPIIFSAHDVAIMMCLLKIARLKSGTHNPDNYIDMCGYAGIAAEIADGQ